MRPGVLTIDRPCLMAKPLRGDGQPSGDQTTLERLQNAVLVGAQVQAGVCGVSVFGKLDGGVETFNVDGNVGHEITLACQALAETHRRL